MSSVSARWMIGPGSFRLFLALLVVADHFTGVMLGRAAVFLFFVLSGFWIQKMWVERYRHCRQPYVTFLVSRLWRLMPIMLAATALAAAVRIATVGSSAAALWPDGLVHTVVSHLFLVGYSHLSEPRLVTPAWSLDIEMQFYLIAPLIAVALSHFRTIAVTVLCAGLVAFDLVSDIPPAFHCLGWFAVGMIAAKHDRAPSAPLVLSSIAMVGGLLAFVTIADATLLTDRGLNDANRLLNQAVAILGIPLALSTCFGAEDGAGRERGNLSYVVYLIHWPLLACAQWAQGVHWLAPMLPAALILPASIMLLRHFDAPLQRARTRWVAGRSEPASSAAVESLAATSTAHPPSAVTA